MDSPWDVIVVGAGAAGLVAAERAAARGRKTLLLEKNRRPGVKILMSGGTRCNLTHATDRKGIVTAYGQPGRFLHSALAALGPQELVALVESEGVPTKIEETGKIFPTSNKATDILAAFMRRLERSGCVLALDEPLLGIVRLDASHSQQRWQLQTSKQTLTCEKLIVTTGGQSYPRSGTSGDGYAWLQALGHTIVPPRPALVPLTTHATWIHALKGITVPDARLRVTEPDTPNRALDERRGSLLFTHFGFSGPVALDISRAVSGHPRPQSLQLVLDFLPTMSSEQLGEYVRSASNEAGKKQVAALVPDLVPRRLVEAVLAQAGIDGQARAAELSKQNRQVLIAQLKQLTVPLSGTRGFSHAEVTAGGVALDEVDSRDMQSKRVPSLYLAGEILDLDGPIGGYNFQAAFSTGWLAGLSV